jgi:hypothetical protein
MEEGEPVWDPEWDRWRAAALTVKIPDAGSKMF